jgi:hypothetical protein
MVYFAGNSRLDVSTSSDAIFPVLDYRVFKYHLNAIALVSGIIIAYAAVFFASKNRMFLRDICNTILFIEVILFLGWLTAHTGGLSKSLYGPGYLALFPVTIIVPRSNWIRAIAASIVALVAFFMSCYVKDYGRELFICSCSILGFAMGWIVKRLLTIYSEP